jgi:polar amino acid transport system permease protein|tara:strand:- start:1954 stop:2637 length:684 start_codon:yes stop_codon:yes gene_type:complete
MEELFINLFGKPEGIIISQLISACRFTIYLSLIAFLGGGVVGSLIVLMRIVPNNILNYISFIYTWLFQSVPLLMLLFLIGLGVPRLLGFDINPWIAATISLILFTSAYLSEVWRGSIQAVSNGQWEAANSLNLNFFQTLKLIILPQAIKFSVAPTISFLIQIIKGTSLAYIIGFHDLMLLGKRWANAPVPGSEPFIIFPLMAVMYFCLCYPLAIYAKHIERKTLFNN